MSDQNTSTYTLDRTVETSFEEAVEETTQALADEGFGVLCDIDVQQKLEDELGEDFRQYRILGACNPPLAHQALTEELKLGALLPCNVIVYETDEEVVGVSAVDPDELLSVVDSGELESVASDVQSRMERALDSISG
ncbi:DUF302 domain-containing protein [Halosimplex halobium]|uniref:DUF302 domain-containing protein n=1 Tax=Halosimplex halobium TaxID=3396618 RepID=UPI003F559D63